MYFLPLLAHVGIHNTRFVIYRTKFFSAYTEPRYFRPRCLSGVESSEVESSGVERKKSVYIQLFLAPPLTIHFLKRLQPVGAG